MSTIAGTAGNNYNPYSSASRAAAKEAAAKEEEDKTPDAVDSEDPGKAGDAGRTEEPAAPEDGAQSLAAYKRDFLSRVKMFMQSPHLANVTLELDISEDGFKRMMQDSAYETSVLDKLKGRTAHSYVSMSGTVSLSANGSDEPSARMTESETMTQRLFARSSKSLLRSLNIDALTTLAEDAIATLEKSKGRFETAAILGSGQMRTTGSSIDAYLNKLGSADSVDTTG